MAGVGLPKLALDNAPHSPLPAVATRSQSGTKLPRRGSPAGNVRSFHERVTVLASRKIGLPLSP